jgi:hypothetical protein
MTTSTNTANQPSENSPFSKISAFVFFVVSTVFLLETRELLNAADTGDQTDAIYTYGL